MNELTSGIFCTTLLAFALFCVPATPVVVAPLPVVPLVVWLTPVFIALAAVDFVLVKPNDWLLLILLVVIAALELTDDVTLLAVLFELQ